MTTPGAPEATMTPEHRSHFEKWCEDHQWTARLTLLGVIQAYRDFCKAEASALRRAAEARDERQCKVSEWCAAAFGADHANSVPQRAVRLLEEAIEAYQAAGADPVMAHKLIDFVFSRPAGSLAQEIGDVGLTLLAIAAAAGASADTEEAREFASVLAKPLAHFTARNKSKNDAGFDVTSSPSAESDNG